MKDTYRIPLFPLELVLVPGETLPLHIFEDRYREMIAWCLENQHPFGVVSRIDKTLSSTGTVAEIQRVTRRYDDGRLDIVTRGGNRFVVEDLEDERSYLTGQVRALEDRTDVEVSETLRDRLVAQHMKLLELAGQSPRRGTYDDNENLSFDLSQSAGLNLKQKQELLELRTEKERVEYLVFHLADLLKRLEGAREVRKRIQSNGHFKQH
jgi:ATP-dependent Lon protease